MSGKALSAEEKFAGKQIVVRELTVIEISRLIEAADNTPHVLDIVMADHDLPVAAVTVATGLTEQELMSATGSELKQLYEAVQNVNPHFAALTERLRKIVDKNLINILAEKDKGSQQKKSEG